MSQLVNKSYRRGPLGWLRDLLLKEQERGGFAVIRNTLYTEESPGSPLGPAA